MIAFDLDGVIVSELIHTDDDLEQILAIRNHNLQPIFGFRKPYYLITGRPSCDKADTLRWINSVFSKDQRPTKIFHDNPDLHNPVGYKAAVLAANPQVKTFIESDREQVKALKEMVSGCRIVWFEEILIELLEGLNQ